MTDNERIDMIRRQAESLHGGGYWAGPGVPSEACWDIRFLLSQLDKAQYALSQIVDTPCPRCDDRDQAEGEAYDGYINAMEMAGLQ